MAKHTLTKPAVALLCAVAGEPQVMFTLSKTTKLLDQEHA